MKKLLVVCYLLLLTHLHLKAGGLSESALFQTPSSITTIISDIKPHTICAGYQGAIDLTWTATDDGFQTQKYTVAVYPDYATNTTSSVVRLIPNQGQYTSITGTQKVLKTTTTQLNSLPAGKYKLAILHASTATTASFSNEFLVASPATAIISDGTNSVNVGDMATVRLTLGGTGPWSYSYDDPKNGRQSVLNSNTNPAFLPLYPSSDYLFSSSRLISFSGYCGTGTVSGSSQIRVAQLGLSLTSFSQPNTCPGSTITAYFSISGTVTTGTRYKLQLSDINGSFDSPRDLATSSSSPLTAQTPVNDAPGSNYKIRIVSEGTVLTSNTLGITLTRPSPPIVSDYSFCLGSTPSTPSAIGNGLLWFSNDGSSTTYGSTAPNPPNNQSSSYRVSQTVNGCASSTAVINVLARAKSPVPSSSSPITYCQNQTATNLTAQGLNLMWSNANGASLGSVGPVPVMTTIGSQFFYVSQDSNGCRSDQTAVLVTITAPPAMPAVIAPNAVCQFAQASNTLLSGVVSGQNLRWYDSEQGGSFSTQAPTPRTTADGTERYYVSQVINGCESNRARLEQTVIKAPDQPTLLANPVLNCLNDAPRSLTATGNSLRWYGQASGGSFTTTAPAPATDRAGDQLFYVTQVSVSTGCESSRAQVVVRTLSQPDPPQVTPVQNVCQNTIVTALKATGDGLQWTGPGIVGSTTIAPTPQTSLPTTLTYQVSQRFGSCISPLSTIQVVVKPQPSAPIVASPLRLCQGSATRQLQASGDNLRWYTTATTSDAARTDVVFSLTAAGTYTYYVRQTSNGCDSPASRLDVMVSAPVRAVLSGDSVVALYDSTAIRIRFIGDAPYTLTLWNGRALTTTDNPLVVWVKPTSTSNTFRLQSLSNDCGTGNLGNSYSLIVLTPLATEDPAAAEVQLTVSPNPSDGPLSIGWAAPANQAVTLRVIDLSGAVVWESKRRGSGSLIRETLNTDKWVGGNYVLVLSAGTLKQLHRRLLFIR